MARADRSDRRVGKKGTAIRPTTLFLSIALVAVLALAAGTFIDIAVGGQDFYLACGIAIAALVLFIGLIYHAVTYRDGPKTDGIRDAIACAFLAVYLVLVIYTVFFSNAPKNAAVYPQTSSLLSSFTSVTAIVVGFYFATGTVDKYIGRRKADDVDKPSESDDNRGGKSVDRTDVTEGSVDLADATDSASDIDQVPVR
jgi:hypothetical protein